MIFSAEKKDMLCVLKEVDRAVDSRAGIPIYKHFMLNASSDDKCVTIIGFNGYVTIKSKFVADVVESGCATIQADAFVSMVSSANDGIVNIRCDDIGKEDREIDGVRKLIHANFVVNNGAGKFRIPRDFAENFPIVPKWDDEFDFASVPSSVLSKMIDKTIFVCDTKDAKKFSQGICFFSNGKRLTLKGAMSKGISIVYSDYSAENKGLFDIVVPKDTVAIMRSILPSDADVPVHMFSSNKQFYLKCSDTEIVSRLITVDFPHGLVEKIIEFEGDNFFIADKEEFVSCIKMILNVMSIDKMAAGQQDRIVININKNGLLTMKGDTGTFSGENNMPVESNLDEGMDVILNGTLYLKYISSFDSGKIKVRCNIDKGKCVRVLTSSLSDGDNVITVLGCIA